MRRFWHVARCEAVDGVRAPCAAVTRVLRRACRSVPPKGPLTVTAILCGTARIRLLNRRYRRKDQATDVLSFSFVLAYDESPIPVRRSRRTMRSGEIYICVPIARRQARRYGNGLQDELRLLAVHGYLHILGYDHATARQAHTMRSLENKLIGRTISRSSA